MMPVPQLGRAVRGWTRITTVETVQKSVVNHQVVQVRQSLTAPMNFQPMPSEQVNKKPEGQRSWKWWSIIIRDKTLKLNTDDVIVDRFGVEFRIMHSSDWRESGFTKYEAVEDYGP